MTTLAASAPRADVFVGADAVVVHGQASRPEGTAHVVDESWRPLCGAPRVRFLFPAADPRDDASCTDCASALAPAKGGNQAEAPVA